MRVAWGSYSSTYGPSKVRLKGRNLTVLGLHKPQRALRLAVGALAICACAAPARAADPERDSFQADVDTPAEVPAEVSDARDELKDDLGSQGLLSVDDTSGAVRFLAQLDGYLDSTPSSDPVGAARDYLPTRPRRSGSSAPTSPTCA